MLDVNGKPLKAGDKITYASSKFGLMFGELKYDADDKKAYHVIKPDGTMYYPQKPDRWYRKDRDLDILNLTRYVEDVLDNVGL